MPKIVCRKIGRALVPVDDDAIAFVDKLPEGRDLMIEATRSRNPRHHRLYWATIKFISENSARFDGVPLERIHHSLKIACGHVDTHIDAATGEVYYIPRSIAYEALGQDEFQDFWKAATDIACARWFPPDTCAEDVRRELIKLVDGPHAIGERAA